MTGWLGTGETGGRVVGLGWERRCGGRVVGRVAQGGGGGERSGRVVGRETDLAPSDQATWPFSRSPSLLPPTSTAPPPPFPPLPRASPPPPPPPIHAHLSP
jgi:hypothetical protein